jgi:hypothetical protein
MDFPMSTRPVSAAASSAPPHVASAVSVIHTGLPRLDVGKTPNRIEIVALPT